MKMPSMSISFTEAATSVVERGERGIIAMIVKDTVPETNPVVLLPGDDIPKTLSDATKEQIQLASIGYINKPKKIVTYVLSEEAEDYTEALKYLKTVKYNYLVAPTVKTDGQVEAVETFVETERAEKNRIVAVLPNAKANTEGIVNFTTEKVYVNDKEYTTEQYCSRIAGIIAGTPMTISCTYAPLEELTDCTRLTKAEMDAAVDAGELIVWWDGEKVKIARGVNSLTTLTPEKNSQFQKIKIVDTMDMIASDIRMTAEDSYLGKYANSYDNKCLLLSAIGNYFEQLVMNGVLESYSVEIDLDANRKYLREKGIDVTEMSDEDVKTANTGTNVFLKASISIWDAIEDIELPITI